jgi:hypothetical protein
VIWFTNSSGGIPPTTGELADKRRGHAASPQWASQANSWLHHGVSVHRSQTAQGAISLNEAVHKIAACAYNDSLELVCTGDLARPGQGGTLLIPKEFGLSLGDA